MYRLGGGCGTSRSGRRVGDLVGDETRLRLLSLDARLGAHRPRWVAAPHRPAKEGAAGNAHPAISSTQEVGSRHCEAHGHATPYFGK